MSVAIPEIRDAIPTTSRKATAAFVLAGLSILFGILTGIPAILCSAGALRDIKANPEQVKGRGLALTGFVIATLGLALQLLCAARLVYDWHLRSTDADNLIRIGNAMFAYSDDHKERLPSAIVTDAKGQPLLSWRVTLLPYLGEKELYAQFHLDEPWDSPHNAALIGRMPKVYAHPVDPQSAAQGLTYYRVFIGGAAPFSDPLGPHFPYAYCNSGTSWTFLVAEAADPVPWTKPDELLYDSSQPIPKLANFMRGGFDLQLTEGTAHYHKGCNVLMADGTVHFLNDRVNDSTVRMYVGEGVPMTPDW